MALRWATQVCMWGEEELNCQVCKRAAQISAWGLVLAHTYIHIYIKKETTLAVRGFSLKSSDFVPVQLASLSHTLTNLSCFSVYLSLSRGGWPVDSDLMFPLYPQRCELCPHKDGALKRTDNGGRIPLKLHARANTHTHLLAPCVFCH